MQTAASDSIAGVTHVSLEQIADDRGTFSETFRRSWFPDSDFVQANLSTSRAGVLRGLHYHLSQEDLWRVPMGVAHVTLVDLRSASNTYLAVDQFELSGPQAVHIPPGVAHGFYAADELLMAYMVTAYYDGSDEHGVLWNDPDLAIQWPTTSPILSQRDQKNARWADVPAEVRP